MTDCRHFHRLVKTAALCIPGLKKDLVHSHFFAGSTEGIPPWIALICGCDILVHVFLQQIPADLDHLTNRTTNSSLRVERKHTDLSKIIGDIFSCFLTPLLDLSLELLVQW